MPVAAIARKEFLDAVRSNVLLGLVVLFALWTGFLAAIQWIPDPYRDSEVATIGLYLVFLLLWDVGLYALQLLTIGTEVPADGLPEWISFLGVCNPSTAFVFAVPAVLAAYEELTFYPESSAWYLQDWTGFPRLAFWAVVALAVGYARFRRADI